MSPHAMLSDTTSVTSSAPFSPFSSAFSVSSEATVVSDQGDQADLGAFQSVFFALSQLQLHHSQQSTGHPPSHSGDDDQRHDTAEFTRSNTPSVNHMSPLSLDPRRSRLNPYSLSSSSTTDTEALTNGRRTADPESDVVLAAAPASSSSAAEDGDEESLALTSPNSHPSSDDVSIPEYYQDEKDAVWTYTEISPYERSFRSSDSHESDGTSPLDDSIHGEVDPDGPSLGGFESAFAFFAAERAKLSKQLDAGKTIDPPVLLPELPISNAKRINARRGGKGHKKGNSRTTLASFISTPNSDDRAPAEGSTRDLGSFGSSQSKVPSSSDIDDSFDARKKQHRGVLPRPSKHILKTARTTGTVPLAIPQSNNSNNRRRPGNHRHSRSLPIDTNTIASLQAQATSLAATPLSEVNRIRSLARRLTFQFPGDAPSLRRVVADPEMAMGLGSHATPSDDALVAEGFFDPVSDVGRSLAPASVSTDAQAALLYVFIDHSNILIGFLEWLKRQHPSTLPGGKRPLPRPKLSHAALALLLERGRKCLRRVLVASSPLYQSLDEIAGMGYQISVLQRVEIKEGASGSGPGRHQRTGSGLGGNLPASASTSTLGSAASPARNQPRKGKGRGRGAPAVVLPSNNSNDNNAEGSGTESDSAAQKQQQQQQSPPAAVSIVNRVTRRAAQQHHRRTSSTDQVGSFITPSNSTTSLDTTGGTPGSAPRPRFREEAVDELLQLKLLQTLLDAPTPPPAGSTIILASGDAARSQFNPQGFLGCVRKAVERGWNVEVVGWEEGRSRAYGELATEVEKGDISGKLTIIGLDRWGLDLIEP